MKNLIFTSILCLLAISLSAQSQKSSKSDQNTTKTETRKSRKGNSAQNKQSPGSADPTDAYFESAGDGWSVIKARSNNYLDDSTAIKLTNMTDAGFGTEFLIESINEEGLKFSSNSDLPEGTTDSILILKANGDVLFGDGNIGIGTDSPIYKLDIESTDASIRLKSTSNILGAVIDFVSDSDTTFQIGVNESGHFANPDYGFVWNEESGILFGTNNIERMRILPNGDIGIGTDTPNARLHIFDTSSEVARFESSSATSGFVSFYNGSGYSGYIQPTASEFQFGSTSKDVVLAANSVQDIIFKTSNEEMRILSTGEIGMGIAAPEAKLHVDTPDDGCNFGVRTGTSHGYVNTQRPTGSANVAIQRWRDGAITQATMGLDADTYQFTVFGDALAVNGVWTDSDAKLKENISTLENGTLEKVMRLSPKTYTWTKQEKYQFLNLKDKKQIGFLAQELEVEFPEVVQTSTQVDADGEVAVEHELKSVNYSALIPVLTKAIQEQQELILELKTRIESLESKE